MSQGLATRQASAVLFCFLLLFLLVAERVELFTLTLGSDASVRATEFARITLSTMTLGLLGCSVRFYFRMESSMSCPSSLRFEHHCLLESASPNLKDMLENESSSCAMHLKGIL